MNALIFDFVKSREFLDRLSHFKRDQASRSELFQQPVDWLFDMIYLTAIG
jgi:hypothetical protein